MTDYRSLDRLEVFRQNERVGELIKLPDGCEFRYEASYAASSEPDIALHLPKTAEPLVTKGLLNLPPYFAGLLPEGIMLLAARTLIRSAPDDLFAILAATGAETIGDVSLRVPGETEKPRSILHLDSAKEAIRALTERRAGRIDTISAIPGVQPKISIGGIVRASRGASFIAKFPSPEFPGLVQNEAACMTLARKCGLLVPRVKVQDDILLVERFDQAGPNERIHVEDLLQVMDQFPSRKYVFDFMELGKAMIGAGVSSAGMVRVIELYAFSYLIGNGDLHAKNVSLIRQPSGQWMPSPAYDLLSTLPFKNALDGAENMALALADEAVGRFTVSDFTKFGAAFGIPEPATQKVISKLARLVRREAAQTLSGALPAEAIEIMLLRAESLAA